MSIRSQASGLIDEVEDLLRSPAATLRAIAADREETRVRLSLRTYELTRGSLCCTCLSAPAVTSGPSRGLACEMCTKWDAVLGHDLGCCLLLPPSAARTWKPEPTDEEGDEALALWGEGEVLSDAQVLPDWRGYAASLLAARHQVAQRQDIALRDWCALLGSDNGSRVTRFLFALTSLRPILAKAHADVLDEERILRRCP